MIGIGVNLQQTAADFPEELRAIATSLRELAGRAPDPNAATCAVILTLDRWYRLWRSEGDAPILEAYPANAPGLSGRRVRVDEGPGGWTGTTAGLNSEGALRVIKDGEPGGVVTIRHGDMVRIGEA